MSLLRDLWTLTRQLPARMDAALRRWVLAQHEPVEVEPGRAWCTRCRQVWPCEEEIRLSGGMVQVLDVPARSVPYPVSAAHPPTDIDG